MSLFPFPTPMLLGRSAVAGHRYWRVNDTTNAGSASFTAVTEIELHETPGGANSTGSGTPISGGLGSDAVGNENTKAFDGSLTTEWARAQTGGVWIGYDFGAGVTKNIVEVALTGSFSSFDRSPATGTVDWSDDGTTWTTSFSFDLKGWIKTQQRILPEAAPATGFHRFWRVFADATTGGTQTQIVEIEFRATSGGADQTSNIGSDSGSTLGRAVFSAESVGNEAFKAFDNVLTTNTGWFASSGANQYVGFVFTSPVAVQEVTILGSNTTSRSPSTLHIQSSDDGTTWTNEHAASGLTWTAGETKTFSVP